MGETEELLGEGPQTSIGAGHQRVELSRLWYDRPIHPAKCVGWVGPPRPLHNLCVCVGRPCRNRVDATPWCHECMPLWHVLQT